MRNFRKHGDPPFTAAVLHGGPGGAGEVLPVAVELSQKHGILEPLQTKDSIEGQIAELFGVLEEHGDLPITLIGHSWGAWLGFFFASRYPKFVKKLILVGSGPYEKKYVREMEETKMGRLNDVDRSRAEELEKSIESRDFAVKKAAFEEFGRLMSKIDVFAPIPEKENHVEFRPDIFERIMPEASKMRESGELLEAGKRIKCPVVAIHGDYDSHPWRGVEEPLKGILKDFRFILIERCGHSPWKEKNAREEFYEILRKELE